MFSSFPMKTASGRDVFYVTCKIQVHVRSNVQNLIGVNCPYRPAAQVYILLGRCNHIGHRSESYSLLHHLPQHLTSNIMPYEHPVLQSSLSYSTLFHASVPLIMLFLLPGVSLPILPPPRHKLESSTGILLFFFLSPCIWMRIEELLRRQNGQSCSKNTDNYKKECVYIHTHTYNWITMPYTRN